MDIRSLAIPDLKLLRPRRLGDARGFFVETYSRRTWRDAGLNVEFVQDNLSRSRDPGTVRGLHCQRPPHAQAKLVSVLAGRVLDVAVDVRVGSPTFGRHVAVELDAESGDQLYVPVGFLHGFVTRAPDTVVTYKVSDHYAADCEDAVRFDDPALAIDWGVAQGAAMLSPKDAAAASFAAFDSPFRYEAAA